MIKIVAMLKRRPGLTLEEFREYYVSTHAALSAATTPPHVSRGIVHYVQNHAWPLRGNTSDPPYDCITEIGFADASDLATWNEWYLGPEGQRLRDDEERFMDVPARLVIVTDELHPGDASSLTPTRENPR